LRKGTLYSPIPRNKQSLIQLLLNTLLLMIENEFYKEALFLQHATKKLLSDSTDFFELTILMYLEGYLELKLGSDTSKAESKIKDSLKIFKSFNEAIYQNYKEHFNKHINNLL
ncbi:MAG: hypothetical protein K6A34_06395, partial [Methanobrevibacter sp.]|nr:hypothetical protein [Methanobrevibacter sp.]